MYIPVSHTNGRSIKNMIGMVMNVVGMGLYAQGKKDRKIKNILLFLTFKWTHGVVAEGSSNRTDDLPFAKQSSGSMRTC